MSTRPHAFVVMPFGIKPGTDGESIYFDDIYRDLIQPALTTAGLESFRADYERRAGDIRIDMFQELLLADLVLADISIDNPNVWYELGVRHALRSRGVVLISGGKTNHAFDIYTDRKLRYGLREGRVDPDTQARDMEALVKMLKSTMESWHGRTVSPVYSLLPNLKEPDWKSLRIGSVCEYWEAYDLWHHRLQQARRQNSLGDMLVLADEAPVSALRGEALVAAGKALRNAGRYRIALETLQRGGEMVVSDPQLYAELLREQGICLEHLVGVVERDHRYAQGLDLERVRNHYCMLIDSLPTDPKIAETHCLAAGVEKTAWINLWRNESSLEERRRVAREERAVLQLAINGYTKAFRVDPTSFGAGINALTLRMLQADLGLLSTTDPILTTLHGAVRFAAETASTSCQPFYALAALAELEVHHGSIESTVDAYRTALAQHDSNRFALHTCREQLSLLRDLGFRCEVVDAALETLERTVSRLDPKVRSKTFINEPEQVILFSGHRMDDPGRATPRFPPELEEAVTQRIRDALERLHAGSKDIAFSQAASGGDIIFLEEALKRGVHCQVLLPSDEPTFLQTSVLPSSNGERWRDRYYQIKERLSLPIREMPDALGPTPGETNAFERCNRWELYSALACGIHRLRFITLWNGVSGDGPGGTGHMLQEVKKRTGRVEWIDIRSLGSKASEAPSTEVLQPTSLAGEASVGEQVV